ncbi:MOSC domain-containing protein [Neorhizobium sp. P12A]|jgi:MOSC domain-containing protein YiiM|uniref:MOSC domain-containing protein n=1 Tax=Neorhizobium sp. P12A TaxID=2268027 RepID=UPI0011EBDF80|nr:MOSC domain-containing protein [Neorhizobium sp. P12A]KAA0684795.1 MOSC domain-containing protein [Neorhizobium sp. P12A]
MPSVVSVARRSSHEFSKTVVDSISIVEGLGVDGDAHAGVTVKHRSRVARDPTQPNLRQVHLIHSELFEELTAKGFFVKAGDLGENVLTSGVALLDLPTDTVLRIGQQVRLKITGLRNPCSQIDRFQKGLMSAVLDRDEEGNLIRKAGVMSVVLEGGEIHPGDRIDVVFPETPHRKLEAV